MSTRSRRRRGRTQSIFPVGQSLTGYRFDLTRSGAVDVLGDSVGALLCDDYRGYDPLVRKGKRLRCGCHAHARRHFFDAGDVPETKEALELVAGMYRVEHEAERRDIVGTAEHLELRRTFARPLFIRLLLLARELRPVHGPKALLGRAARYTWRNQTALGRFLHDARIRLDNNFAEGAMRIVALGRKNFLFVHSEDAGKELRDEGRDLRGGQRVGLLARVDARRREELDGFGQLVVHFHHVPCAIETAEHYPR